MDLGSQATPPETAPCQVNEQQTPEKQTKKILTVCSKRTNRHDPPHHMESPPQQRSNLDLSASGVVVGEQQQQQSQSQHSLSLLTVNVFTAVPEPFHSTAQRRRLPRLARILAALRNRADHDRPYDVLVLTEVMTYTHVADLLAPLAAAGWPYCTRRLTADHSTLPTTPHLVDGGVFVVSRWPLLAQQQYVFTHYGGSDALAAKGATYASVLKHGKRFHVVGTHLQAWDTPDAHALREQQTHELCAFLARLGVPADEPLVFGADLNIDRDAHFLQLRQFLHAARLQLPPLEGALRHTLSRQNPLYGWDSIHDYRSDDYPTGCADEYARTRRCECCPEMCVDYVASSAAHQRPMAHTSRIVPLQTVRPYRLRFGRRGTEELVRDVTDHYAVVGMFWFASAPLCAAEAYDRGECERLALLPPPPTRWYRRWREATPVTRHSARLVVVVAFLVLGACWAAAVAARRCRLYGVCHRRATGLSAEESPRHSD
jgi:endonuclease/exonuclease/phosphatase (EEP) superfamily protein YafD